MNTLASNLVDISSGPRFTGLSGDAGIHTKPDFWEAARRGGRRGRRAEVRGQGNLGVGIRGSGKKRRGDKAIRRVGLSLAEQMLAQAGALGGLFLRPAARGAR